MVNVIFLSKGEMGKMEGFGCEILAGLRVGMWAAGVEGSPGGPEIG